MKNLTRLGFALLIFSFVLSISVSRAQTLEWIKSTGDLTEFSNVNISCSTIDESGNIYIAGTFIGSFDADFDGTVAPIECTDIYQQTYLIKMDSEGAFLWAKTIAALPGIASNSSPNAIVTYNTDKVCVVGGFTGEIDFDPSEEAFNLTSTDPTKLDGYIWTLDGDGNLLWAQQYGGENNDQINDINADKDGNLFLTGNFTDSIDFDSGPDEHIEYALNMADGYLLKLNIDGDFIWVDVFHCSALNIIQNISISPMDEVYISGFFLDTIDADPGVEETILSSPLGINSMLIAKFNLDGDLIWAKQTDGLDSPRPDQILADSNFVYITSRSGDTLDLDPGIADYKLFSGPGSNSFVQKLDADGDFVWGKNMGGTGNIRVNGISKDLNGYLYLGGFYQNGAVDLDPSEGSYIVETPDLGGEAFDLFIQTLDQNGDFKWAFGSESLEREQIKSLTINESGDIFIFGDITSTACDFDLGPETVLLPINDDIFVWKMTACENVYETLNPIICETYTVPSGDETYTFPGTYMDTVASEFGCDTIFTINLASFYFSVDIEFDGDTYTAYPPGATYQWVNCKDSFSPIEGETGQTYTPLYWGEYAVVVSYEDCILTSECLNSGDIGISALNQEQAVYIRPNPSNGKFTINTKTPMNIQVYSSIGKLILRTTTSTGDYNIDLTGFSQGVYMLSATTQDGEAVINKKIIIN